MTERARLRRLPEQGSHRPEDLHAVLDRGFVCHLGIEVDGYPMVVPTSYGRSGDALYLHGSVASHSLRAARQPVPVCVTVTLVDGVVLARSVFNHSVNYRCAMVFGVPEVLTDRAEQLAVGSRRWGWKGRDGRVGRHRVAGTPPRTAGPWCSGVGDWPASPG